MKSPQLDAAYEKIAFLFKKIQQTTEPPLCRNDIEDTWEHILETNENKAVVSDENTPMAQIAKMYIMEYYTLSLAIGDSAEYAPIQTALRLILVNITKGCKNKEPLALTNDPLVETQTVATTYLLHRTCEAMLHATVSRSVPADGSLLFCV